MIVILAAAAEMSSSRFAALNAVGRRSMAAHAAAKPSLPAAEGVKVKKSGRDTEWGFWSVARFCYVFPRSCDGLPWQ